MKRILVLVTAAALSAAVAILFLYAAVRAFLVGGNSFILFFWLSVGSGGISTVIAIVLGIVAFIWFVSWVSERPWPFLG